MIRLDGTDLYDLGVRVVRDATGSYAARDVETETIPGRNGALVYDNGAFLNVTQTYTIYIPNLNDRTTARNVAAWLLSHADTYYELWDDYEPDVYRLARYSGGLDVAAKLERYGSAQIQFDCKPQRFLASEDIVVYPVVSGYLSSGAFIAGDTNDRRTGYIPVSAGDEVTVTITYEYEPDDGTAELIFASYSATGGYSSYYLSGETNTPTAPGTTTYTYTVPSGAYYVVIAWKSSYATVVITTADSSATYTDAGAVVYNETLFEATPSVKMRQGDVSTSSANVQGFAIGDTKVTVVMTGINASIFDDGVIVDCESMNTYVEYIGEVVSENNKTTVWDTANDQEADKFPVLSPGENVINTYSATMGYANECPVTEIVISPRWWTV